MVDGWALEAICEHLEAITFGHLTRLLINVPPGFMKSLLTDVLWPAWEWSAMNMPYLRYVAFSYSSGLTERDNGRFRDLLMSEDFKILYGDRFELRKIGETRVTNDKTGFKLATSVGGVGTGERGDRVIVDDPHNVKEGESEVVRSETVRWFRESAQNRLNNMSESAIVVIMQRVHEADVSGTILAEDMGYEHLMIPMEYDWERHCATEIGWDDPRGLDEDGEPLLVPTENGWAPRDGHAAVVLAGRQDVLAWPERFPEKIVDRLKVSLGPYAYAGQYRQSPTSRGGSILKREYWQLWEEEKYPAFEFVLASADTAYTEKEENDPTGFTIWGVFRDRNDAPKVMLIWAWAKHCELHGKPIEKRPGESKKAFDLRSMPTWGLVEWIAYSCRRFRVDKLLIEAKASGLTVAQEMQRLYREDGWSIQLVKPVGDKVARAHAVEPSFAAGLVYAPDEDWAEKVIAEAEVFPKGKRDDLVDSSTQALQFLRTNGLISHNFEVAAELRDAMEFRPQSAPLYDT